MDAHWFFQKVYIFTGLEMVDPRSNIADCNLSGFALPLMIF
jgi:hypothetical protein